MIELKLNTIKKWKRDALEQAHKLQKQQKETFLSVELIKQCQKTAMLALLLEDSYYESSLRKTAERGKERNADLDSKDREA